MNGKKNVSKKLLGIIVLLSAALISMTVLTNIAASPKTHTKTYAELDEVKEKALGLTASVAVTSTAIALVPGDATTPIANQMSELTTALMIIVCAIYLEKFLLTTLGYTAFRILIPVACVSLIGYILFKREILKTLAIKLSVFAIVISMIIPASMKVTNMIDETFNESITTTFEAVDEIAKEAENVKEEDSNAIQRFWNKIGNKANQIGTDAKNAMGHFIDAIAVLIITTCVVPISVIFFFIWIIKILFGVNIDTSKMRKIITEKRQEFTE